MKEATANSVRIGNKWVGPGHPVCSDHAASVEIGGLMRLVSNIRDIERSLGDGVKRLYATEMAQRQKLPRPPGADTTQTLA